MDGLRWLIEIGVVSGLIGALFWMRRNPRHRWLMIAPLTVMLNTGIYHTVRLLQVPIPVPSLNLWSAAIHLHLVVLFLLGLIIFWRIDEELV